ncbi:hypothetical protein Glove_33g99 [Diversispora epigaea]|uniref:Uncharacterized protein n=1 Tax=Diversispora epigaea TaxID=1348612 RepID=A0A397JRK0_9GLOM|nr:hypothetical protein Glove_33g99 [Diversispora epigaea]
MEQQKMKRKHFSDEKKAFQWCLKSAEGGNRAAMFYLRNCYLNGIRTVKDEEKAFQWYLKSDYNT